jgi:hypothetical protein
MILALAFIHNSGSQTTFQYDPWADINDDGIIDTKDIGYTCRLFGKTGDPTKNVNVTNWDDLISSIRRETFPRNLILRATWGYGSTYTPETGVVCRMLIDQDTPYPNSNLKYTFGRQDYEVISAKLNTTDIVIYDQKFVYEKIPTKNYRILGMSTVSLTFNVSNAPSADFILQVYVTLGIVSITNTWTPLVNLGCHVCGFTGSYTDYNFGLWFNARVTDPITINATQRLAVRIEIHGYTRSGTTNLTLKLLHGMDTDEFLVSIPIVEN